MAADLLLILMMNQPNEKHSLVGKIYEYIYLQKPIIVYEKYKSETSRLVMKYKLGYSANSEDELGDLLKIYLRIRMLLVFLMLQGKSLI